MQLCFLLLSQPDNYNAAIYDRQMQAQKETAVELHQAKKAELDIAKENAALQRDLAKIDLMKTCFILLTAIGVVGIVAGAFSFCCVSLSVFIWFDVSPVITLCSSKKRGKEFMHCYSMCCTFRSDVGEGNGWWVNNNPEFF